ncbi:MAG: helix-turn-helix transcriptional regulator [Chitinophaga sp.]|uniref:helix-turn-helix domain-containing protein n=1 Tax=Chitinophaga sp. TaxID=1869181 RepID=UPI0025BECBE7|nr:helix-turn-helix transcriptional regulator [Chitinophaga sp.]MBV8255895.1 helix-turn-helix transcriptional regulator [Chitinophaga sp.]
MDTSTVLLVLPCAHWVFSGMAEKNENIAKQFGANLRKIRKGQNLTQVDVAFDAELEPSYMTRLENGRSEPSLSTILVLAKALKVKVTELLEGIEI